MFKRYEAVIVCLNPKNNDPLKKNYLLEEGGVPIVFGIIHSGIF